MATPGQAATQLTSSGIKDQQMNRNDSCIGMTIFSGEKNRWIRFSVIKDQEMNRNDSCVGITIFSREKNRWIRFSVIKDQQMYRNDSCVGITISPYAPTREGPMLQNKDMPYCQVR